MGKHTVEKDSPAMAALGQFLAGWQQADTTKNQLQQGWAQPGHQQLAAHFDPR
jgi:hypothetical protein